MTDTQLRELIRSVVVEVLADRSVPAPAMVREPRNALVLFTGALLGFEASLESLKRLKATGAVNLDWTQTPSASKILDQNAIAAVGMCPAEKSLVMGHDLLIVPTATVNMLAKVANGIGDCLASNVLAEFIMLNKPVVVATNAACPDSADKRGWFPNMPEGYAAMLRGNLATIKSFGVRLSAAEKLDLAVLKKLATREPAQPVAAIVDCPEKLIHDGIISPLEQGTTLRVGAKALITALARETAAARHITVERMD